MVKELAYTELKSTFIASDFNFKSTKDLEIIDGIIGQERAEHTIDYGLNLKKKGYNIYVSGNSGTGKNTLSKRLAEKIAANEPPPPDLCYIYNFDKPNSPKILYLKHGMGNVLKEDINELIEQLLFEIPKALSTKEFEDEKYEIITKFEEKRENVIKIMTDEALENNFAAKLTSTGIYFSPIVNGKIISEEEYDSLTEKQKHEITKNTVYIQNKATEITKIIKEIENETQNQVEQMQYAKSLFTIGKIISPLLSKYKKNNDITDYLVKLKEDILENLNDFIEKENLEDESVESLLPWITKKNVNESKYKINVLVDNRLLKCAPVISVYSPTYSSLIGEIEYDNEYGNNISTDFMKITAGILHKANGGYLILQAQDVLTNSYTWEALRRVLITGYVNIEPLKEFFTSINTSVIKPEPVKINIKIIMVGSFELYDLFYEYDSEFKKLFKVRADFDCEMERTNKNIEQFARFIKNFVSKENSLQFDTSSILKVLELSSRLAENQTKLSTEFGTIEEILIHAEYIARKENCKTVSSHHIKKAVEEQEYFLSIYENKFSKLINNGTIMINTDGFKIGEINGLAVLDIGNHIFGKPSKITATTYCGKSGIVNIEKESHMSGNIHDKGVQILIGYLGQTYAQDFPLSLSCRICFEQSYSDIDGDSASSAELYAIISSLSGLPINQQIAVTGSINQRGEIQPIGGVTYKVEGFFDLCEKRGLTGGQGVIIPIQNVKDLVLKECVIEAVKNGKFHIYPISNVNEGIEILTGFKSGKKDENDKYSSKSIHGKVLNKLKHFYKKSDKHEEEI